MGNVWKQLQAAAEAMAPAKDACSKESAANFDPSKEGAANLDPAGETRRHRRRRDARRRKREKFAASNTTENATEKATDQSPPASPSRPTYQTEAYRQAPRTSLLSSPKFKGYTDFVKETLPEVRAQHPDSPHNALMRMVGERWRERKHDDTPPGTPLHKPPVKKKRALQQQNEPPELPHPQPTTEKTEKSTISLQLSRDGDSEHGNGTHPKRNTQTPENIISSRSHTPPTTSAASLLPIASPESPVRMCASPIPTPDSELSIEAVSPVKSDKPTNGKRKREHEVGSDESGVAEEDGREEAGEREEEESEEKEEMDKEDEEVVAKKRQKVHNDKDHSSHSSHDVSGHVQEAMTEKETAQEQKEEVGVKKGGGRGEGGGERENLGGEGGKVAGKRQEHIQETRQVTTSEKGGGGGAPVGGKVERRGRKKKPRTTEEERLEREKAEKRLQWQLYEKEGRGDGKDPRGRPRKVGWCMFCS